MSSDNKELEYLSQIENQPIERPDISGEHKSIPEQEIQQYLEDNLDAIAYSRGQDIFD